MKYKEVISYLLQTGLIVKEDIIGYYLEREVIDTQVKVILDISIQLLGFFSLPESL
jgi:hypothetical protein